MLTKIKTKLYDILSTDLSYNVMDNPYENQERTFPYVMLTLGNVVRDILKNNAFQNKIRFKIDIFSDYDGEKEVLEMEQAIFEKINKLYDIPEVTYVRESSFKIIDDKSTGTVKKHGVIQYTIITSGMYEEVKEEEEPENGENSNTN